ncbi:hypothetical protein Tco_0942634, partial [Tanacetum coccineum]
MYGDDEENPKEDPEEDPEEEPESNNGLVNQFALHVDPHQPGVMIGWLEENVGANEGGDKTPPPRDESSDSEPPNAEPPNAESSDSVSSDSESYDSESEDEEADIAPEATVGTVTQRLLRFVTFRGVYLRVTETEMGTCQTEIALLKLKNKIGEKEREILNHDLGNVEHVLGDVLERLKV